MWYIICSRLKLPFLVVCCSVLQTQIHICLTHLSTSLSVMSSDEDRIIMYASACSISDLSFLCVCVYRCAPGFLGEYCHHKDPCHPSFCLNGGNCSVSMSVGVPVPVSASCKCPLGYTGQHCQTPQNSTCYPNNPCGNQGVCTLLSLEKYRCNCARGWTGEIMYKPISGPLSPPE